MFEEMKLSTHARAQILRAKQRKKDIESGKIKIDIEKPMICRNCYNAGRLFFRGLDVVCVCNIQETEDKNGNTFYKSMDPNDACENFQY